MFFTWILSSILFSHRSSSHIWSFATVPQFMQAHCTCVRSINEFIFRLWSSIMRQLLLSCCALHTNDVNDFFLHIYSLGLAACVSKNCLQINHFLYGETTGRNGTRITERKSTHEKDDFSEHWIECFPFQITFICACARPCSGHRLKTNRIYTTYFTSQCFFVYLKKWIIM